MGWGERVKLINEKCHMHKVRQPVMAGWGTPCPGSPLSLRGLRAVESGDHPCQCPPRWAPGRPPRCWHPNEKVNIEPKDLGGRVVAGRVPRGPSCLGPAWLSQDLPGEMAPRPWGRDRLGNGSGEGVGSSHCVHWQKRGLSAL